MSTSSSQSLPDSPPSAEVSAEPSAPESEQFSGIPTQTRAETAPDIDDSSAHSKALDGQPVTPPLVSGRSKTSTGRKTIMERIEAFLSKLSTRNNFWHRVCSMIWLPYAFRSGIQMKQIDQNTFTAVLPFRRFNKNWYNAMAGAALLGNSEIAGGMYVFAACGGDYIVVCKHLDYQFLRPCFGPAEYKITPRENIKELVASGSEFNITIDLHISQKLTKPGGREKRIGKASATFHVTPKVHNKQKRSRRK